MHDSTGARPSDDKGLFRELLASSKNIIILSGAGLSAPSGIPTYRGSKDSLWSENDPMAYVTPEAFEENPSRVWQFYHRRRALCLSAQPNDAHRALACLSIPSLLARIAPLASPPWHITQNIDALSLRVLESLPSEIKAEGTTHLLEMHGSIFVTRCQSCQHTRRSDKPLVSSALESCSDGGQAPTAPLPRCGGEEWAGSNRYGKCGGLLRPEVVWFGEIPPLTGEIARKMNWCDLLIAVGTSSTVYPAAGFASQVKNNGGKVAVFNLDPSDQDYQADYLFLGNCERTLPDVLDVQADIASLWPQN